MQEKQIPQNFCALSVFWWASSFQDTASAPLHSVQKSGLLCPTDKSSPHRTVFKACCFSWNIWDYITKQLQKWSSVFSQKKVSSFTFGILEWDTWYQKNKLNKCMQKYLKSSKITMTTKVIFYIISYIFIYLYSVWN